MKKNKIIICFEWEFMAKSERKKKKKKKKRLNRIYCGTFINFFRETSLKTFKLLPVLKYPP
jgi:hypothetical protein